MFDIGFMELVVIAIVSLLVVGPERLPGAIRTGALWVGRAKRSFNQVKADIEREINADEIRRQLHNESILADIEKAKKGADKLIADTKKDLEAINHEVSSTLTKEKVSLENVLQDPKDDSSAPLPSNPMNEGSAPGGQEKGEEREEQKNQAADKDAPDAEPPPSKPVEDFYNNPPAGIIRLQGGVFQQVVADAEDSDQEPQRKS